MRKQWGCSWNGYNAGIEETVDLHKYQRNFEGLKDDLCGISDKSSLERVTMSSLSWPVF